ncbi:MAG: hypothetical protein K0S43_3722 [Cellulosimicrobium sp.]|jgi:hypothetical protein|nr:hypothetical protein [Cellulosimicrobium sp.]
MPNVCAVRVRKGPDGLWAVIMSTEDAALSAAPEPVHAELWKTVPWVHEIVAFTR